MRIVMIKNQNSGLFLVRLQKWLCGKMGKMTGRGNALKTKMLSSRKCSSRKSRHKILRHEPLEERQLLAVDVFGGLADFGAFDDAHNSSQTSYLSCCETLHPDETALVSQALLEETSQNYGRYFADENYSPVRPMRFDDGVAYDTFTTWKATISPEIFASIRNFFSQENSFDLDNVDSWMLQQALETLPPLLHGQRGLTQIKDCSINIKSFFLMTS